MANKRMPRGVIYEDDKNMYKGRFQYSGERYTVYGKTIKEVTEKMDLMRFEVKHGIYCKPKDETVSSWYKTWIEQYKKNTVKPSTLHEYQNDFRIHIEPVIGKKKMCDIQSHAIQKLINDMHTKGYSKTTISNTFTVINGMFKQAFMNQIIIRNPCDAVSLPKWQQCKKERRVMTQAEQDIFLKYAEQSSYYDVLVVALQTGMRISEILGLEWDNIDFEKKEIQVTGTLVFISGQTRYKGTPKTFSGARTIPMLPEVEKILHSRRKWQLKNRMVLGSEYGSITKLKNPVMTCNNGEIYWAENIRTEMRLIVKRINDDGIPFEAITPHTLRHTFATRCAEQGMPLQVLKNILGHSSLAMTSDLYSHVLPDTKHEEMKKINFERKTAL